MLAARTSLVLVALLLIPLGVSAQMACCAGMVAMQGMEMDGGGSGDGMSCCDEARDDALARRCCEGGERLDRSHSTPQVIASLPVVAQAALVLSERALVGAHCSSQPPPRTSDLFTLHSAFLI